MAFQQVPDTAEFRAVYQLAGEDEFINTYYVRDVVVSRVLAYFTGMADAIRDALVTNWLPNITEDYALVRVDWRDLDTEFGLSGTLTDGTPGAQTTPPAAPQVALLCKLVGDAGAAPRQGRVFLCGGRDSDLDGATSLWTAGLVASAVASEDAITAAISANVITSARVIVSRYLNKALRATATTNTLQDVVGRRLSASQRDRRPGIGS